MFRMVLQFHEMRDAAVIVKETAKCDFDINMICCEKSVNAKSLLGVIGLGADRPIEMQIETAKPEKAGQLMKALDIYRADI